MTQHNDLRSNDNGSALPAMHDANKKTFAPERLDSVVLQQAAQAVTKWSWPIGSQGWLRPAAYVATLGVCIALFMPANDTPVIDMNPSDSSSQASALRDATHAAAERMREADQAAELGLQGMPENGYSGSSAQQESAELVSQSACEHSQRLVATSWESCIVQLQAEGESAAAAAELAAFRKTFPDYRFDTAQ